MAIIKCKMCGGDLILEEGSNVAECEYCGSRQTVPSADNEKKLNLFARANRLRANNEFDKASGVYESIVADFPEEAEAYWGLILCKYGIEYVDDPGTGNKIPTCHRSSFDSVMDDPNFELVMENADPIARRVYREEAKQLEELRKGIIEVSSKEEPYDIFICYKETDAKGDRTLDSVLAQDVYDMLTENGYRVFFSRVTLEDKLGQEYEPYIFAALNSAKIMLAFGTDYDYYNAVWVKNEWSRFLQLIAKGEKKTLIPCYKNIDAYDMPKEFAKLQAQDLGKVGANQDLLRGIKKILPKGEKKPAAQQVLQQNVPSSGPNVTALLKRGYMALEDQLWDKAKGFFDQVLNIDAENHDAYLGLTMAQAKTPNRDAFQTAYVDKKLAFTYIEKQLGITGNLSRARQYANAEQSAWWNELDAEQRRIEAEQKRQKINALAEPRRRIASVQAFIKAGNEYTVGLRADGTVIAVGNNDSGQCDVSCWKDIVAISVSADVFDSHTLGLKADGTVVAVGSNDYGQCNVSGWRDVVAVSAGGAYTVGLKVDGTVVAVGSNDYGQCNVSGWTDIVAVSAGSIHTVGLKADGTVVAVGDNDDGECDVSGWRDIVAVSAGAGHTVGLKSDGTVVATQYIGDERYNCGQCDVHGWTDIVAISAGHDHTIGLKADGTVVATGDSALFGRFSRFRKDYGQCYVSDWRGIVAISAGRSHSVGLKSDGTVVATKYIRDHYMGQCDVANWRLFHNYMTIDQERKEAAEQVERKRIAAERRRLEENKRKRQSLSEKIAAAEQRQETAKNELSNLKGFFAGRRRKELEKELSALDTQIQDLQKQIDAIQD